MNKILRKRLKKRKRRIERRLNRQHRGDHPEPVFAASNIQYELADRAGGVACGGIGLMHMLARQTGLMDSLDDNLDLLKIHHPYHESYHVLNLAYTFSAAGRAWRISSFSATTRSISTRSAPTASRIPPRQATSVGVSRPRTSKR